MAADRSRLVMALGVMALSAVLGACDLIGAGAPTPAPVQPRVTPRPKPTATPTATPLPTPTATPTPNLDAVEVQ